MSDDFERQMLDIMNRQIELLERMVEAGKRWGVPEYFTGDACNATYAARTEADTPFIRGRGK